jgi:hypothetical protein
VILGGDSETESELSLSLRFLVHFGRRRRESRKTRKKRELKKRKEENGIKGKRIMGTLNASFTLHPCLLWQHLLRHGTEGCELGILVLRKFNIFNFYYLTFRGCNSSMEGED